MNSRCWTAAGTAPDSKTAFLNYARLYYIPGNIKLYNTASWIDSDSLYTLLACVSLGCISQKQRQQQHWKKKAVGRKTLSTSNTADDMCLHLHLAHLLYIHVLYIAILFSNLYLCIYFPLSFYRSFFWLRRGKRRWRPPPASGNSRERKKNVISTAVAKLLVR